MTSNQDPGGRWYGRRARPGWPRRPSSDARESRPWCSEEAEQVGSRGEALRPPAAQLSASFLEAAEGALHQEDRASSRRATRCDALPGGLLAHRKDSTCASVSASSGSTATATGWVLRTSRGDMNARQVIVASGPRRRPFMPDWPGREDFRGRADPAPPTTATPSPSATGTCSSSGPAVPGPRSPATSSKGERAVSGSPFARLRISWIRNPVGPLMARMMMKLPTKVADAVLRRVRRLELGDLSPYGLPVPEEGVFSRLERLGVAPMIVDKVVIDAIKEGQHRDRVRGRGHGQEGRPCSPGATGSSPTRSIAATGYRSGLEPMDWAISGSSTRAARRRGGRARGSTGPALRRLRALPGHDRLPSAGEARAGGQVDRARGRLDRPRRRRDLGVRGGRVGVRSRRPAANASRRPLRWPWPRRRRTRRPPRSACRVRQLAQLRHPGGRALDVGLAARPGVHRTVQKARDRTAPRAPPRLGRRRRIYRQGGVDARLATALSAHSARAVWPPNARSSCPRRRRRTPPRGAPAARPSGARRTPPRSCTGSRSASTTSAPIGSGARVTVHHVHVDHPRARVHYQLDLRSKAGEVGPTGSTEPRAGTHEVVRHTECRPYESGGGPVSRTPTGSHWIRFREDLRGAAFVLVFARAFRAVLVAVLHLVERQDVARRRISQLAAT